MKRTAVGARRCPPSPRGTVVAQGDAIVYSPNGCIRAGEAPLMQLAVEAKGELRGLLPRVNTTDCAPSKAKNLGQLSNVVLPKFEAGRRDRVLLRGPQRQEGPWPRAPASIAPRPPKAASRTSPAT